jgi:hypothetical protein
MPTYDEIERFAVTLPETVVAASYGGSPAVKVNKRWLCQLSEKRSDPTGEVLILRVADLGEKEALLASDPAVFFTSAHYDGYPTVLVRLGRVDDDEIRELLLESWTAIAPKRAIKAYEASR